MADTRAARLLTRNTWAFGLGTVGRDMVYALVSMFLVFYLSDVIQVPNSTMWWLTGLILATRLLDAFLDPIMGTVVDNTRTLGSVQAVDRHRWSRGGSPDHRTLH